MCAHTHTHTHTQTHTHKHTQCLTEHYSQHHWQLAGHHISDKSTQWPTMAVHPLSHPNTTFTIQVC